MLDFTRSLGVICIVAAEWDAMLPPLALLADAARVLPPRSSATHVVRLEELDPAREIPAQPIVEAVGGTPAAGAPEFERPVIQRPEEPLQMPSRAYSETRGPVEHSALGGDEVDAIADVRELSDLLGDEVDLAAQVLGGAQ